MNKFKQIEPSDVMVNLIDGKKIVACVLTPNKVLGRGVKDVETLTVDKILKLIDCKNVAFFMEVEKE